MCVTGTNDDVNAFIEHRYTGLEVLAKSRAASIETTTTEEVTLPAITA